MVNKTLFLSLFLLLNLFSGSANAANIRVFVDRQNINVDESFNLVFEADGSVDSDPDFSPLSIYFDILNRSQSSNMTIINGNFSRKTVWTLVLLAKQAGNYAIPSIEFGNDKSPSLNIKIHKSSSTQSTTDTNLFLEAEIDHSSVYVQAQLIYTIKLFRSIGIQNASLTEPELSDADAIVEKLGEDNRYQITRNGVNFVVIERRYAIFPQQSGQLSIKPVEFNGQIVAQRRSFFDSSSFNNTTKRIYSKQINIDVKPVPASFKNKTWLPSSELKLVDEWPEDATFIVGEPVTRTITLLANGLTAAQLPEIAVKNITGIKQYPDQPSLNDKKDKNGIIGIRQEKIAFIPTKAGPLTLPELNISWWNTKTEQIEYARIEAKQVSIQASTSVTDQPEISESLETITTPALNAARSTAQTSNFWFYSSIVLLLALLSTLTLLFNLKRDKTIVVKEVSKPKPGIKNISKKFVSACHQENKELCKSMLIEWACQHWPDGNFNNLADVAEKVDADFRQQINILNQCLYSQTNDDWHSAELLSCFEEYKGKPLEGNKNKETRLKTLHKLA